MYLDLLLIAFIYTPGLIAAGLERYIGQAPVSEFKFYMVRTHVYGFFSYSFAVLVIHLLVWPVFKSVNTIDISDGIFDDINFIGFLIAFICSIPIAIVLSITWSFIMNLELVAAYIANKNWRRKNNEFSALQKFHSANLLSPKRSIVWEFDEKVKYIGIINRLEEQENFLEIIIENLTVENFDGIEISNSHKSYIRVAKVKVRIDSFDEEE